MTKKIDEAVSLNISNSNGDMTSNTTITAADIPELAQVLKNAGIAGNSNAFNGPATLTVDVQEGGSTMTSTINSPDLRSIMNLLEPQFAAMSYSDGDDDHIVDPLPSEEPCVDGACEPEVDMGADLEEPKIGEEADYDYRTNDTDPKEYADMASKTVVQPDTKRVPARSGDNPLSEGPFDDMKDKFPDTEEGAIEFMKFMSSHDMNGATAKPDPMVDGVWMVCHNGGKSIVYLNDMDFEDLDESTAGISKSEGEFRTWILTPFNMSSIEEIEVTVGYTCDESGVTIVDVLTDGGDDLLDSLRGEQIEGLEAEALDHHNDSMSVVTEAPYKSGGSDEFDTWIEDETVPAGEIEVTVHYDWDTGDFDTGLDHMPIASMGSSLEITAVINKLTGEDLIDRLDKQVIASLEQQATDHGNSQQDESVAPKSFRDYVEEATAKRSKNPQFGQGIYYGIGYHGHHSDEDHGEDTSAELGFDMGGDFGESELSSDNESLNELSGDLKGRYAAKARDSKDHHEKKASDLDDLVHDAEKAERMGIMRKGAGDRVAKWRNAHDRTAWKREKGLDRLQPTAESLLDEFNMRRMPPQVSDYNEVAKKARELSKDGFVQHVDRLPNGTHTISDWMSDNTVGSFSNGHHIGGQDIEEASIDEVSLNYSKGPHTKYGAPFYLNTDCGYASLEDIKNGTAQYFDDMSSGSSQVGVTVLEIDRNGKKGLNFVSGLSKTPKKSPVTCITRTSTGSKYRPGKVITYFTSHDLVNNYDMVVDLLAEYGVSPTKKLSVKTFD